MAFIDIKGLLKEYSLGETRTVALNGIDLEINKGELVILFGPSGAGKTTLLNMIGGLDIPNSGTVTVDEIPVSTLSAKWLTAYRKKKIGVVFQFFNLLSRMSAIENIEYAIDLIGVKQTDGSTSFNGKIIKQKAQEYLDKVGLEERMHHFPAQLSGGEQQRVSIARALAKEPEILLADEPTGNLDFDIGRNVLEIMEAMTGKAQNRTVVIVTHNPAICPLGDRVVRLSDGKVVENYSQKYTPAKELYW
ncbi:MAG: ABC transporter ATP-binding protein [Candidatus Hodarchaeales archaeon]|jgi:putative ABC transport system ATP-binding protein